MGEVVGWMKMLLVTFNGAELFTTIFDCHEQINVPWKLSEYKDVFLPLCDEVDKHLTS